MGDSIADRYRALAGAQPNPNPPSPDRLRLEAAVMPKVDAVTGALMRWRAGLRGEGQPMPAMPVPAGGCP